SAKRREAVALDHSETFAVETTSECTHPPCPWPRQCRRQQPHLVPSSTPFLARFGLKAHATVRVEEDTGSVPRSPTGSRPLSTRGLRSSDGRLVRTARSHILAEFADTRARTSRKTTRAGNAGCSGLACGDCRLLFLLQAGHGCGLHPAFPAPSSSGVIEITRAERAAGMLLRAPPMSCPASSGASSIPETPRLKHSRLWNTGSPGRSRAT